MFKKFMFIKGTNYFLTTDEMFLLVFYKKSYKIIRFLKSRVYKTRIMFTD